MSFDAIVDFVVEKEAHSPPSNRDVVAVALHHRHLPKLAEAGFIIYDSEHGLIMITDESERIRPYLAVIRGWANLADTDEEDIG